MNGSYGATANTNTRHFGTHSNRANNSRHFNRFERRNLTSPQPVPVADATYVQNPRGGETHSRSLQPRDYATNYSRLGNNILDPTPTTSFMARLNSVQEPLTEAPHVKSVDGMPSNLRASFRGEEDDWYKHVDVLELDLFQKYAYHPMQCYFAFKNSLAADAKDALCDLETNLVIPRWGDYIPFWFTMTTFENLPLR